MDIHREVAYYDNTSNKLYVNCDKNTHTCDVIKNVNQEILCKYDIKKLIAVVREGMTVLYFEDCSQIRLYNKSHFYYA